MNVRATAANLAWLTSSAPAWRQFKHGVRHPAEAQDQVLQRFLRRNADCAYGRQYGFREIKTYREFAARIPLVEYEAVAPWIRRIQGGERAVLTVDRVTHLVPTSGSSGARKLIPFTASLQQSFNAAIGPWLVDLWQRHPALALGPAYWSITPAGTEREKENSAVPIGFEDDSDYLGGFRKRWVETVLAVPSALGGIHEMDTFRYVTLLCLLREPDLRLISVWHPSFLTLLLDTLPVHWDSLLADLREGQCRDFERLTLTVRRALKLRRDPARAAALARANPHEPESIWPRLHVVSCWGSAAAAAPAAELCSRFPNTTLQAKGLLATEAVITLPFAGQYPLAVCSHFFEFIDEKGNIHPVGDLEKNQTYEVIVTTGGGLWRYRLHDRVEVTGFVEETPSLTFLGRGDAVSDLFGEKLSELFVAKVLDTISREFPQRPTFMMIAPEETPTGIHYVLYIEGAVLPDLANKVEEGLNDNPHYAHCRKLGQLQPLQIFQIQSHAHATFLAAEHQRGRRLGDIKPQALSRATDWSLYFTRREPVRATAV